MIKSDLLLGKAPLTLVRLRAGTAQYVYAGGLVPTESVDEADAQRLVDEGYLVPAVRDGEFVRPVVDDPDVLSPGTPGMPPSAAGPDPGLVNTEAAKPATSPAADSGAADGADVEAARAEARAKLPEDGSAPKGNAAQAVWVEYAVRNGYSYEEASKQDRDTLKALLQQ